MSWSRKATLFPNLNRVIGGGLPCPGVTQIYGPPHSGKTTLAAGLARAYRWILIVDSSRKFGPQLDRCSIRDKATVYLPSRGVSDTLASILYYCLPEGEGVVIVDDLATLPEPFEVSLSSFIFDLIRKCRRAVVDSKCSLVLVNQQRSIGPGSKPFMHSVVGPMVDLELRTEIVERDKDRIRVKVTNEFSLSQPGGRTFLDMYYSHGPSVGRAILDDGISQGKITRKGNVYYYKEERLGPEKEATALLEVEYEKYVGEREA